MDILQKKLIHYKNDSFTIDGKTIERHTLLLENTGAESSFQSECTVVVPAEVLKKLKLDEPTELDKYRGKEIELFGLLYDNEQGYNDKNGNPRTRKTLKFNVLDIHLTKNKQNN